MKFLTTKEITQLFKEKNINADKLEEMVVQKLISTGKKVATAESCTGGLVSKRITEVSGASAVFDCGVCSYSNEIKSKVLGVRKDTLEVLGAVSAETAMQMAEGVKKLAGADIGISTTGIAGPTGGTPEKPVGLVYVGVSTDSGEYAIKLMLCEETTKFTSRNYIRKLTSDVVLYTILSIS